MPNTHKELEAVFKPGFDATIVIDGNESMLSDIMSSVQVSVKGGVKALGGKLADGFVRTLKESNQALLKAVGARRLLLSTLANRAKKDGVKEEVTFPAALLKRVTVKGKASDIVPSIKLLEEAIKQVYEYEQGLEACYYRELELLKSISSIKETKDAASLLAKLDSLQHAEPKFPDHNNSMFGSKLLPGGRQFLYNEETCRFSISNEDVKAEDETTSFAEGEMVSILGECNRLLETYNTLTKCNDRYAKYIAEFNTVVGKSFSHLEELKGSVSATLLNDLESRLQGDPATFAFYTGFLPKVVLVVDNHVEALTSFLSKHFN